MKKLEPIHSPKVGDKVFSVANGNGVVTDMGSSSYPVEVVFEDGECEVFRDNGALYPGENPILFQGHLPENYELYFEEL